MSCILKMKRKYKLYCHVQHSGLTPMGEGVDADWANEGGAGRGLRHIALFSA